MSYNEHCESFYELPEDVMSAIQSGEQDGDGFEDTGENPGVNLDSSELDHVRNAQMGDCSLFLGSINRFADWNL